MCYNSIVKLNYTPKGDFYRVVAVSDKNILRSPQVGTILHVGIWNDAINVKQPDNYQHCSVTDFLYLSAHSYQPFFKGFGCYRKTELLRILRCPTGGVCHSLMSQKYKMGVVKIEVRGEPRKALDDFFFVKNGESSQVYIFNHILIKSWDDIIYGWDALKEFKG